MMKNKYLKQLIILVSLALLSGCTCIGKADKSEKIETVETVPNLIVKPNNSGIDIGKIKRQGPSKLMGNYWNFDGSPNRPDVPSRIEIEVKRTRPLQNKEPRYFTHASGLLQVVSIERYYDYQDKADLEKWRKILRSTTPLGIEDQKMLRESRIAEIPWINAGRCFHGSLRKRSFPWGDAVLFLTSYVQGKTGGPVNNDMLVLVVQGFTKDNKYAINARFAISHKKLPDTLWDEKRDGRAFFSIDDETIEAERWMNDQPDDSFTPTINQYELFLSSLEISPGKPYINQAQEESDVVDSSSQPNSKYSKKLLFRSEEQP